MMREIIFLSHDYMEMIEAAKINKDSLLEANRRDFLSPSDIREIERMTNKAFDNGIFEYYKLSGLSSVPVDSSVPNNVMSNSFKPKDYQLDIPLHAYCPNQNSIILWQGECDTSCSRNLFRENLKNILKAMTRVMSFDDVVKSEQFELLILRA